MGVPAFFRWLSRKYPSVIIECVENKTIDVETGKNFYDNAALPNPNGIEFDNLYLDMNGIIHPCTHPEDKPPPKSEDEMMVAIFDCIDRLMSIVRPRKLLYMAIDGVAPRAKMNQQRSRRFRAAKESAEKRLEVERIRSELLAKGCILPPEEEQGEHFDSNCITPGTPFMDRLSRCLHYYIHERLNSNPAWMGIKVILSDANVPGEGEHKIMDYIRRQRSQPDHDPNTQHVLCGADADLIMLGLATHEPNFTIIREEFLPNKPKPCDVCNKFGHEMTNCAGLNAQDDPKSDMAVGPEVKYIFVRLSVLREYLKKTLQMPGLPFMYDFERALDDWVFMCFFVGNDFLPHLPSLEIREGAVDRLVELYKKCVYRTGGYITKSGEVNLDRVQLIMTDLGNAEDHIFKERQRKQLQFKAREKRKHEEAPNFYALNNSEQFRPIVIGRGCAGPSPIENYKEEAAKLRNYALGKDGLTALVQTDERKGTKRTSSEANLDDEEDYQKNDEVRMWEDGFKDRYYESKFDVGAGDIQFRYSVALQYVRGLCWVLKYYYQGCASWKWYFPYHYAPFASDFVNVGGLSTAFEKQTMPFKPLEQLMGVFPAASSAHVPKPWATLMSEPNSPIIDFYPEDFKIDLNGKKFAWQGVALLPFVDESRLFKALKPLYPMLTSEEVRRNLTGDSRLYLARGNPNFNFLKSQCKSNSSSDTEISICMEGMRGKILMTKENVPLSGTLHSPIKGLHDITDNWATTVLFRNPVYPEDFIFPSTRHPKAVDPPNVLAPQNRGDNYRPQIGFTRDIPQASLGIAGHRMINNYTGRDYHNIQGSAYAKGNPTNSRGTNNLNSMNNVADHRNNNNNYIWQVDSLMNNIVQKPYLNDGTMHVGNSSFGGTQSNPSSSGWRSYGQNSNNNNNNYANSSQSRNYQNNTNSYNNNNNNNAHNKRRY